MTQFYSYGENAVAAENEQATTLAWQQRAWWVADAMRTRAGVVDVVPGMNNLTVIFEWGQCKPDELLAELRHAWEIAETETLFGGRLVEIPVRYGGEFGPDLAVVAAQAGMSEAEVITVHSATCYTVYCLGFQPGFPYLAGMDPRLAVPRRSEPRLAVPAGSVGIGGNQTGIYSVQSPGGWHIIGRTDIPLFDPAAPCPTLLQAGDQVRFVVVGGDS